MGIATGYSDTHMFSDLEGKVRFDKDTNVSYIDKELDNHYFQQQKIKNERFLDSWEVIGDHLHEQIECFRPTTTKSEKKPAFGEPDTVYTSPQMGNTLYA
jgi:hypothetical protein